MRLLNMRTVPLSSGEMLAMLDANGIGHELHTHPPLGRLNSQSLRGQIEGAHIKNLYLQDGKSAITLLLPLKIKPSI